jgi:peroxiredoxin
MNMPCTKRLTLTTGLIFCLVILLIACDAKPNPAEGLESAPRVGYLAPDFTLEALDGSTVTLSDLRGTPVFLNFWNTNCQYCKYEMPIIQKIFERYSADELVMYGVNNLDTGKAIEAYMQTNKLSFPMLLDGDEAVTKLYMVTGLPTSFFIDEDGIVRVVQIGEMSTDVMAEHVKTVVR